MAIVRRSPSDAFGNSERNDFRHRRLSFVDPSHASLSFSAPDMARSSLTLTSVSGERLLRARSRLGLSRFSSAFCSFSVMSMAPESLAIFQNEIFFSLSLQHSNRGQRICFESKVPAWIVKSVLKMTAAKKSKPSAVRFLQCSLTSFRPSSGNRLHLT